MKHVGFYSHRIKVGWAVRCPSSTPDRRRDVPVHLNPKPPQILSFQILTARHRFSFFQLRYMILSGKSILAVASVHVSVVVVSAIAVITAPRGY